MQYAAHLPTLPSKKSVVVPLVALVVGAGAATATYAVIDDNPSVSPKVIVVDRPAATQTDKNEASIAASIAPRQHGSLDTRDEASVAAGIGGASSGASDSQTDTSGPDEAAIGSGLARSADSSRPDEAAIASALAGREHGPIELRGSKASTP